MLSFTRIKSLLKFSIAAAAALLILCVGHTVLSGSAVYANAADLERFFIGDVDMNSALEPADARLALRYSLQLDSLSSDAVYLADYNKDNAVNPGDARMILRSALELEKPMHPSDRDKIIAASVEQQKQNWYNSITNSIAADDLSDNMHWLVEQVGIRSWWDSTQNNAADLLYNRLCSYGFSGKNCSKIDFSFTSSYTRTGRNVLATVPTSKSNPDIILVLAHYDTARGTGGAVDNSSGTVSLLQLAKRFLQQGIDYGVELRFLLTAGEEQGYFGAYKYVEALSEAEKNRHKICFNMDMTGKPNANYKKGTKYYLAVSTEPSPKGSDGCRVPDTAAKNIGSNALDAAKNSLGNLGESGYYSPVRAGHHDIIPFRKAEMPALTLSWRVIDPNEKYNAESHLAEPSICHLAEDNIANFDMTAHYNTTRLAANAIARLLAPYMKWNTTLPVAPEPSE